MKQSTWRGEGEEEEERGRFSLLPLSLSLPPVASPRYFFGALNERRPCSIGCNHLWREGSKVASWKEGLLTSWTAFRTGQKRTTRGFPFHYLSLSLSPFCLLFLLSSLSSFASSSSPFFSLFFRLFLPFRPATDVEWGSTMRGNRASGEFLLTAFETSRRGTLETDVWSIRDSFHIPDVSSTLNLNRNRIKGEFIERSISATRWSYELWFIGTYNWSILIASVSMDDNYIIE